MIINHSEPYEKLRAEAYQPVGDQLDAIFKLAAALKDQGINLPPDVLSWIDHCQKVKDTYAA